MDWLDSSLHPLIDRVLLATLMREYVIYEIMNDLFIYSFIHSFPLFCKYTKKNVERLFPKRMAVEVEIYESESRRGRSLA